ncbi:MAG: YabP/YqfC family sporulation protein [Oscillospiraceae bacterium]
MFNSKSYQEEKETKIKGNVVQRLAKALDVPDYVFEGTPQICFSGNKEAIMEGVCGILEYNPDTIRLSTKEFVVKFSGQNLHINSMTCACAIVEGQITGVEFLTI